MASNGLRLLWRWTLISNCRNLRDASLVWGGHKNSGYRKKNLYEHFCGHGNVAFCNILRNFVTGFFWKEMSYLVIFVRDNPLFDRLTFTIFIFKDINNECVFLLYPNLLISPNTISAWSTKYDVKPDRAPGKKNNI